MVLMAQMRGNERVALFHCNLLQATLLTLLERGGQTFEEWTARLEAASVEARCAALKEIDGRGLVDSWPANNNGDRAIWHYSLPPGRTYRLATPAERLEFDGPAIGYKEAGQA